MTIESGLMLQGEIAYTGIADYLPTYGVQQLRPRFFDA